MTKRLPRIAALAVCALLLHVPAAAQLQRLPRPLPWGITGAEASAMLRDSGEMRIAAHREGREIYATSQTGLMQAVAVLARDTLVGLIYFQPENRAASAYDMFSLAVAAAEREYGPPYCRQGELAVWEMPNGLLEVRVRRPRGDGHAGAEIRFSGPGFAEEMSRRAASAASAPRPAPAPGSGPRLLGTPVDSVAPPPAEPAADPVAASAPAASDPAASLAAMCS